MSEQLMKVLQRYGLGTAIAIALTWLLAGDVKADLKYIKESLSEHAIETNFYLRAICINTSQTETQRANCIPGASR